MKWQPIETAPKDGTRIILLAPKEPQPVTSAKWCGYMWLGGPYDNSSVHPTHWMPFKTPNIIGEAMPINKGESKL